MLPVVKEAPRSRRGGPRRWYNVASPRRSGGIGRRAGLKIRWCESTVSVRARPPVLLNYLQIGHFSLRQRKAPRIHAGGFGSNAAAIGYERASSIAAVAWSRMFGST